MQASIRTYRAMDTDAIVQKFQEEFIERVRTIEGFLGYYVVDGGDGTVATITLGETEAAVEASNLQAQRWVIERAAHLVEGAPDVTAGEVRVRVER
ncbi:MAG: hypothetical protein ACLP8S_23120 [Solirubrobacteraceae bacterium]